MSETVLSLDPSSTVVGWAVMTSPTELVEAGLITPALRSDPSYDRIRSMRRDLFDLLGEVCPDTILIEWTKGKVARRKRPHTQGAGLAVYGAGVGAMATECEHWADNNLSPGATDVEVIPILENTWTRGVPKKDRQLAIAAMFNSYRISADPGGDMADAIGLAVWWFKEKSLFSE